MKRVKKVVALGAVLMLGIALAIPHQILAAAGFELELYPTDAILSATNPATLSNVPGANHEYAIVSYSGTATNCAMWTSILPITYNNGEITAQIDYLPTGNSTDVVQWQARIWCAFPGTGSPSAWIISTWNTGTAESAAPNGSPGTINALTPVSALFITEVSGNCASSRAFKFELCRLGTIDANNEATQLIGIRFN